MLPLATLGGNGAAVLPSFSITVRDLPDKHVVALHGELDVASADGLADALVEEAGLVLVVDLSDLTFMDCSGIAALVAARSRIRSSGLGQFVLTRPGVIVRKTLEIVGLGALIMDGSPWLTDRRSERDLTRGSIVMAPWSGVLNRHGETRTAAPQRPEIGVTS